MREHETDYPGDMNREELIRAIARQSLRNQAAIEHADMVLEENRLKTERWRAEMEESDKRTKEAAEVLRRAGFL